MTGASRQIEEDPLAGLEPNKPVIIEELEKKREEQAEARRAAPSRLTLSVPTLVIDYPAVGVALATIGFLLMVVAILVLPRLPDPIGPYTLSIKLVLLCAACLISGIVLLRVAIAAVRGTTTVVLREPDTGGLYGEASNPPARRGDQP